MHCWICTEQETEGGGGDGGGKERGEGGGEISQKITGKMKVVTGIPHPIECTGEGRKGQT